MIAMFYLAQLKNGSYLLITLLWMFQQFCQQSLDINYRLSVDIDANIEASGNL